jgi:hypothetical protein
MLALGIKNGYREGGEYTDRLIIKEVFSGYMSFVSKFSLFGGN